ncbi:hypothetical protein H9N28_04655 [Rhodobacter capsulatus]|uniref:hypothetical protein n=1 Tax=Rhodobacter capsulatus TaxID=1061 RepID=UPI0006DD0519|nr:hypothetical protein [Rhodobacter capsulatus]KQB11449.1 hypothetical protein AP071_09910 [Rhodobacter capsulatus]KQB12302.1 hypothetical protein AP073_06805 [Rhodobacter capsulatus]PZX25839.1 hypothetical protein LY44_01622 [Rhodobacter capsulatus]QNR64139.1 hypothetical protein H9N28_04655 [Rhodobacter capsulatus]
MIRPARPQLSLRTGVFARWLAVLAVALQSLLFAEHLSAAALQDLAGLPPGARAGFLQLCTGEGVALYDPASGRVVQMAEGHAPCAICASAAVCAFAMPAQPDLPPPQLHLLTALDPAALIPFAFIAPVPRSGLIRAPPVVATL